MTGDHDNGVPHEPADEYVNTRRGGDGEADGPDEVSVGRLEELLAGEPGRTDAERDLLRVVGELRGLQPTAPDALRERIMATAQRTDGAASRRVGGRWRAWHGGPPWVLAGGVVAAAVAAAVVLPRVIDGGGAPVGQDAMSSSVPAAGTAAGGATGPAGVQSTRETAPAAGPESVMAPSTAAATADTASGALRVTVAVGAGRGTGGAAGQMGRILTAMGGRGVFVTGGADRVAIRGGDPVYTVRLRWPLTAAGQGPTPASVRAVTSPARRDADVSVHAPAAELAAAVVAAADRPADAHRAAGVRAARDALVRRDAARVASSPAGGSDPGATVRLEIRILR